MINLLASGCDDEKWEKLGKEYDECVRPWASGFGQMRHHGYRDKFCGSVDQDDLSLPESQVCSSYREAYKIQDCLNLLKQCKTLGPGEPAQVQQNRIITTMLENCDEWVKRRMTVPKPMKRKRVKRSEPSEGQQKDQDRDL